MVEVLERGNLTCLNHLSSNFSLFTSFLVVIAICLSSVLVRFNFGCHSGVGNVLGFGHDLSSRSRISLRRMHLLTLRGLDCNTHPLEAVTLYLSHLISLILPRIPISSAVTSVWHRLIWINIFKLENALFIYSRVWIMRHTFILAFDVLTLFAQDVIWADHQLLVRGRVSTVFLFEGDTEGIQSGLVVD